MEPGFHELTLPGSGRRYTLVIPRGYTGAEPVPMVVSLHYGGRVTPFYGRGLLEELVEPALRELGAIMVAPDSGAGGWTNPQAERHVLELMDHVQARYNIDAGRTLVTGYSMGGRGTWYFAARHPNRFAAAVVLGGQPQADAVSRQWKIPMYVIHGSADEILPLEPTRSTVRRLQERGAPLEFLVLEGFTHYEVPRYVPALTGAVPWIRTAWGE